MVDERVGRSYPEAIETASMQTAHRELTSVESRIVGRPWRARKFPWLRRLFSNPRAVVGLAIVTSIAVAALLAPLIAGRGPDSTDFSHLDQLPSGNHWFGTDYLGRDMWSRVLYGARTSLIIATGIVLVEAGIGIPLGLAAGYFGGIPDAILMRGVDVNMALPGLLLPLGIIAVMGPGVASLVVALGIAGSAGYARLARAMTLSGGQHDYVSASRVTGSGNLKIVVRHVLPNISGPMIVQITLGFGGAILAASALSYLGLGVQPPQADWGSLISAGYDHMFQAWSEIAFPGIMVCLTLLGLTLLGDGLADAFNPRLPR